MNNGLLYVLLGGGALLALYYFYEQEQAAAALAAPQHPLTKTITMSQSTNSGATNTTNSTANNTPTTPAAPSVVYRAPGYSAVVTMGPDGTPVAVDTGGFATVSNPCDTVHAKDPTCSKGRPTGAS